MHTQPSRGERTPGDPDSNNLDEAIHSTSPEVLNRVASDPSLNEELALTLLARADLPAQCLTTLSKNTKLAKYRKVRVALVSHAATPRHVSLLLLRLLYTFDLMQVALTPVVSADIKRAAEEVLLGKLDAISAGEKLTLARRASGRVAAALLLDRESRVMQASLENPRLTEALISKAVLNTKATVALVEAVCRHPKWSFVRDVRISLLRTDKTPLARALEFARSLPPDLLREVLQNSRLPASVKACLMRDAKDRSKTARAAATQF